MPGQFLFQPGRSWAAATASGSFNSKSPAKISGGAEKTSASAFPSYSLFFRSLIPQKPFQDELRRPLVQGLFPEPHLGEWTQKDSRPGRDNPGSFPGFFSRALR